MWEGGLSIQGALVGGLLAAAIYTAAAELDFFEWTDIVIPGVALAQAIGRWGNFFNQEAFGAPCDQPWCIPISQEVLQATPSTSSSWASTSISRRRSPTRWSGIC